MAAPTGNSPGVPFMQPGQYDSSVNTYLNVGNLPSQQEGPDPAPKSYGDPERELIIKQAPLHARVALGKEKDRKPVDPPPVIQLIDKRASRKSPLYNSPYLFVTCSLVTESFAELTRGSEPLTSYLTGSLASSIHHLKDNTNADGGFFVFGDLAVKREGRFRLRFTLFDRDNQADPPSVYFVSEIITSPFTVYSPKEFPGMAESTFLTRSFTDQGVKLRLRKDSRAMTTRKRNRRAAESADVLINRQFKRPNFDRSTSIGGFGGGSSHTLSPEGAGDFTGTPDMSVLSGPSTSQTILSTSASNSSPSVDLSHTSTFLSSPITSHFPQGYPQFSMPADITSATSLAPSATYHQGYHPLFSSDARLQQPFGPAETIVQGSLGGINAVPGRPLVSQYAVASDHLGHLVPDLAPRMTGILGDSQYGNILMKTEHHESLDRQNDDSVNPYGVLH